MNATTKRLALALALSLCANLFAAGFVVARTLQRAHHHDGFRGPFFGPHGMMHDARGPLTDSIRGAMQHHRDALRTQRVRLRDAQRSVQAALGAEPYDAQALGRALSDLRGATAESQRFMHDVLLELAGTLAPEQRRELLRNASALTGRF